MEGSGHEGSPRFVGRTAELRQIRTLCELAERGRGSLVMVSGEVGIGKTRFCDAAAHQARRTGITVVTSECWGDGAPAMWPWPPILSALTGAAGTALLEHDGESSAITPERFARFQAVTESLVRSCTESPACVVIDDVHLAGPSSLLLLRFVARSLERLPLVLVLARRSSESPGMLDELDRQATPIVLRHLDLEETATLLAAHGLDHLDPALVLTILRVSRGNPLFLRRIAALGPPNADHDLPEGLRAAIDEALTRVPPTSRHVIQVAATVGLAPSISEVAALSATEPAAVIRAAEQAAAAGLVRMAEPDRFTFTHESVRAAAEDALDPQGRLDAHAGLAAALQPPGARGDVAWLARRAQHALQAAPRSADDARIAVGACRDAGGSMIDGFAYERADELLTAAVDLHDTAQLGPPPPSLLLEHARAALLCGRLTEARVRFDRAAQAAEHRADAVTFAAATLGLGGVWVNEHRSPVERSRVLGMQRAALARLPGGEVALRCRLRARLAAEAVYSGAPVDGALAAVNEARECGDLHALAEALSLCHHALLAPDHVTTRLEMADELVGVASEAGLGVLALMGLCWRAVDLFHLGDLRSVRALEALRERADALQCRSILFIVESLDAMMLMRAGQLDEAQRQAEHAFASGSAAGDVDAFAYLAAQTFAIHWIRGHEANLAGAIHDAAASPTLVQSEFAFRATAILVAARAGDTSQAHAEMDALGAKGLATLPRSSTWLAGLASIVEAAAMLGNADVAREAYRLLEPFAALPVMPSLGIACFGSTERTLGLAASTWGDTDLAVSHLGRAVAENQRLGNRPLVAIAQADLARVLGRRGRADDLTVAARCLDEALAAGREIGMTGRVADWERDRQQLPHAGPPPGTQTGVVSRQGTHWVLSVGDHRAPVSDLVGMTYLAELLTHPGQPIAALNLASHGVVADHETRQPMADGDALQAYRRRAQELASELEAAEADADIGRAEQIRIEMDALVDEIERSTGLGGRARSFAGSGERARTAVRKAIKRAIDDVATADPAIGALLRDTIATGSTCAYAPDARHPVTWTLQSASSG